MNAQMGKEFNLYSLVVERDGEDTLTEPPIFPCSEEPHEPFLVRETPINFPSQNRLLLWGTVRTVGDQFDGDRTDVHDIFAIVWASVMRAFGLASPILRYEEHIIAPNEIGACHVAFTQCPWRISETNFQQAKRSMTAWTSLGFHLLDEVFKWYRIVPFHRSNRAAQEEMSAPWVPLITRYLKNPNDVITSKRRYPNWHYFASRKRGISIIRMPITNITALKRVLSPFSPDMVRGEEAYALFANGIPNAIPYRTIKQGQKLLSLVENKLDRKILILPIDSHCLFIGERTIIAVEGEFGYNTFQKEQELFFERRVIENRVFFAESKITWNTPLNARSMESLCLELIQREPGVIRAKPVGDTNDRDGGRDIVIDWRIPTQHTKGWVEDASQKDVVSGGVKTIRIIAQIKYRSKTIGKRDVQDIRDTLEHYEAGGFLLIAHPRISSSLLDHLEKLRNSTNLLTDWWDSADLERKLKQHPDIARCYPDILTILI
ncbi:restriction endonuclease [Nitrosomonas oligotropha]|uniref:restriction endonuclease n=1 Tax=Nitrosomonas oligotropha TaxID=42354 RepID=UPI001367ED4E|nr:restriction endonuclease [Nitrosomonas oligotropha]MXS83758.1 hypothetical protein [Nitrosomonas oligotropha]